MVHPKMISYKSLAAFFTIAFISVSCTEGTTPNATTSADGIPLQGLECDDSFESKCYGNTAVTCKNGHVDRLNCSMDNKAACAVFFGQAACYPRCTKGEASTVGCQEKRISAENPNFIISVRHCTESESGNYVWFTQQGETLCNGNELVYCNDQDTSLYYYNTCKYRCGQPSPQAPSECLRQECDITTPDKCVNSIIERCKEDGLHRYYCDPDNNESCAYYKKELLCTIECHEGDPDLFWCSEESYDTENGTYPLVERFSCVALDDGRRGYVKVDTAQSFCHHDYGYYSCLEQDANVYAQRYICDALCKESGTGKDRSAECIDTPQTCDENTFVQKCLDFNRGALQYCDNGNIKNTFCIKDYDCLPDNNGIYGCRQKCSGNENYCSDLKHHKICMDGLLITYTCNEGAECHEYNNTADCYRSCNDGDTDKYAVQETNVTINTSSSLLLNRYQCEKFNDGFQGYVKSETGARFCKNDKLYYSTIDDPGLMEKTCTNYCQEQSPYGFRWDICASAECTPETFTETCINKEITKCKNGKISKTTCTKDCAFINGHPECTYDSCDPQSGLHFNCNTPIITIGDITAQSIQSVPCIKVGNDYKRIAGDYKLAFCQNNTLYWCENNKLQSEKCASSCESFPLEVMESAACSD